MGQKFQVGQRVCRYGFDVQWGTVVEKLEGAEVYRVVFDHSWDSAPTLCTAEVLHEA